MKELWKRYREAILYIFFGGCTFLVDTGMFFLFSCLIDLSSGTLVLHTFSILSTVIAIIFAYVTNRTFVFESKAVGIKAVSLEMFRFFSARFFTLVLAEVLMEITVIHYGLSERLMKLVVNVIVILLNYFFSKFWIFKKKTGKFDLCVFDLDGTLVNSIYDIADAMNHVLEQMGKPAYPLDAFYKMVGAGMENLCRNALPDGTEEEIQTLISLYKERYIGRCAVLTKTYDGIDELLCKLRKKGIRVAILSNKPQAQTDEVVDHVLDRSLFWQVIGQSDRFPIKPDPQSLLYLIQESGIKTDKVCYIGDSNIDMILGKTAGVCTVGAGWGFRGREELMDSGADFVAETPEDLVQYIF